MIYWHGRSKWHNYHAEFSDISNEEFKKKWYAAIENTPFEPPMPDQEQWPVICPECKGDGDRLVEECKPAPFTGKLVAASIPKHWYLICAECQGKGTIIQ